MISGVSIYAVNKDNDNRTDKELAEDGTDQGVKKVADLGVFAITTTWSVIAYCWLFYALLDYEVTVLEAALTFIFFWVLLAMAVGADMWNRSKMKARENARLGEDADLTKDEIDQLKK